MAELVKQVTPDGVTLNYLDTGHGEPALLFVHGWCCDHTYWSEQTAHFAQTNRVVAVDLRGHGSSDKPDGAYPISQFTDDVAWLIGELQLARPVVIGHSMGGCIVADLAARYPQLTRGAVLVDAAILFDRAALAPMLEAFKAGPRPVAEGIIQGFFTEQTPAHLRESIPPRMLAAPHHVLEGALLGVFDFDSEAGLKALQVPAWLVAAPALGANQVNAPALNRNISFTLYEGAGHFLQAEQPERFNKDLQSFVAGLS